MTSLLSLSGTSTSEVDYRGCGARINDRGGDLRLLAADVPAGFVPTRWAGYLEAAAAAGDVTAYRHYWELCVLMGLRDGLRSGDVHVPGSRRYADPASFLLAPRSGPPGSFDPGG